MYNNKIQEAISQGLNKYGVFKMESVGKYLPFESILATGEVLRSSKNNTIPTLAVISNKRQSGHTTASAGYALADAYYHPGSKIIFISAYNNIPDIISTINDGLVALDAIEGRGISSSYNYKTHIEFSNGSHISFVNWGNLGDGVRGHRADMIIFDNAELYFNKDIRACTLPCLMLSKRPLVLLNVRKMRGKVLDDCLTQILV